MLSEASWRPLGGLLEASWRALGDSRARPAVQIRFWDDILKKLRILEVPVWNLFELKIVFFRLSRGIGKELRFWMEFGRVLQTGKREKTSFPVRFFLFFVHCKQTPFGSHLGTIFGAISDLQDEKKAAGRELKK